MFKSFLTSKQKEDIFKDRDLSKKYNSFESQILNEYDEKNFKIENDLTLIFRLLFKFIYYLIKLPFYIILLFLNIFLKDKKNYFSKIIFEPFLILKEVYIWFIQARYTCYLLVSLWFFFFLQMAFLNEEILKNLISHPEHLVSIKILTNISSLFFHGNLIHIISNSIALIIFGRVIERNLKSKIILVFLCGGFISNTISNIIQIILGDFYYSLGASSGIAALIIVSVLIEPFFLIFTIPIFLIGWTIIFLDFIGLTNPSQTNNLAHISGYLSILLLSFFFSKENKNKLLKGFIMNIILLIIFGLLVFSFDLKKYFLI